MKKMSVADKLLNEEVEAARRRGPRCYCLHEIEFYEMAGLHAARAARRQREQMLKENPGHWTCKLATKIDRLINPELTGGKHSGGAMLGRMVSYKKSRCTPKVYNNLLQSRFTAKIKERLQLAKASKDRIFRHDFNKALNASGFFFGQALEVYFWLLNHRADVESCKTVAEIIKLRDFPKYERTSFYRVCREVGLPVGK